MVDIKLRDFQPISRWTDETGAKKWDKDDEPLELIDQSTGRTYPHQSKAWLRFKCSMLSLGSPILHPIISLANAVYRIFKLISCYHFWIRKNNEQSSSLKGRLKEVGWDLLRVVGTPLALLGLLLAPLYGLITPYNGRKLYATFERALYGKSIIAPCFQPNLD